MKNRVFRNILLCLAIVMGAVTVNPLNINAVQTVEAKSRIKLNVAKKSIYKGKKYTLKVRGTKRKVKWSSSNKKIATVTSKGKVTAKRPGSCYIYAKVRGKRYKCKISVLDKITGTTKTTTYYVNKVKEYLKRNKVFSSFKNLHFSTGNDWLVTNKPKYKNFYVCVWYWNQDGIMMRYWYKVNKKTSRVYEDY
jgi:hypothetical protein